MGDRNVATGSHLESEFSRTVFSAETSRHEPECGPIDILNTR
jgi:hypothetical protein